MSISFYTMKLITEHQENKITAKLSILIANNLQNLATNIGMNKNLDSILTTKLNGYQKKPQQN